MCVRQISISLDNEPGKFLDVSQILGNEGINIRAISVADTADISTVRFVTDSPEKTTNVLRSHGYSVRETDVTAVEVPDHPGGLQAILRPLKRANINVLYLYLEFYILSCQLGVEMIFGKYDINMFFLVFFHSY